MRGGGDLGIPPFGAGATRARDYMARKAHEPLSQAPAPTFATVTADDLMSREYHPPKWAVPDLVPEGLTILAGKPKTGKSWLGLDFCVAVASGGYALGNVKCEPGPVLYLALEDTLRRLQGRLGAVLQGSPAPRELQIATEWRRADKGGLVDIQTWLFRHKGARLVVIDTLQKVRGARPRDAGIYEDDYKAIADIKKLADEFHTPIVVVHHQNKAGHEDPLLSISGTAGVSGSADSALILERKPKDINAELYIRGRDVIEGEIAIQFDSQTCKWVKVGKAEDWRISEERRAIVKWLIEMGPMQPKEIAIGLNKKQGTVRFLLHKMMKDGDVTQRSDGKYAPC